LTSTKKYDIKG